MTLKDTKLLIIQAFKEYMAWITQNKTMKDSIQVKSPYEFPLNKKIVLEREVF